MLTPSGPSEAASEKPGEDAAAAFMAAVRSRPAASHTVAAAVLWLLIAAVAPHPLSPPPYPPHL